MRLPPSELYAWLAALPPAERDAAVERRLGVDAVVSTEAPGAHLVGHHMTGVAALVRALHAIPVRADDRVLDLGAGLGKVLMLTQLLTGAAVSGIEIQPELVRCAPPAANITHGDVRTASLDDASVIFLYCPFNGPVLDEVSRRLDDTNAVVCALGIDLLCKRLVRRPSDDFWMTIWEAGAPRAALAIPPLAHAVAHEQIDHGSAFDPANLGISPPRAM